MSIPRLALAALLALAVTPAFAQAPPQTLIPGACSRLNMPLVELVAQLYRDSGGRPREETGRHIVFMLEDKQEGWFVTLRYHPLHPTVTCRTVVRVGDRYGIQTFIRCGASREACDAFAREAGN